MGEVDNVTLNTGTGGAVIRTDDDGSAHWQYVKLAWGADNTQTIVTTANPIPVDLRTDNLAGNLDVNIAASAATVTVSGTVTANAGTGTLTVTDDGSFTLAANAGVIVGDVNAVSVVPGTAATNLGKAIDTAAGGTDTGVAPLAVRDDALLTLTPIDGDYVPLRTNSVGALWVQHNGDITIADGGNTITVDGTVTATPTGTYTVTDDGSFTLAANSGVDVGDVTINNAAGASAVNIQDGGNSITVDGTVTANAGTGTFTVTDDGSFVLATNSGVDIGDVDVISVTPGTAAANLGKAEDAAHLTGDVGVMALGVRRDADSTFAVTDGDYVPLQVDANGYLKVEVFDGGGTHTVDQATASNFNAQVVGEVAHDGADSGNPVKVGGVARTANPTAVGDGDRANLFLDKMGRAVTVPWVPRELVVHNRIALTSTTETTLIAAGGAGVYHDLVMLTMSNESATEVRVDIRDDTAGTVRQSFDLAADGGGAVVNYAVPLVASAVNDNWTAQLSGAVSTVYITAVAIKQV